MSLLAAPLLPLPPAAPVLEELLLPTPGLLLEELLAWLLPPLPPTRLLCLCLAPPKEVDGEADAACPAPPSVSLGLRLLLASVGFW